MLVLLPVILILVIIANFEFLNIVEHSNNVGDETLNNIIQKYNNNVLNTYKNKYAYIHLNNYKRYKKIKERYFNIILFHNKICQIDNLSNNCYIAGKRQQCFSKDKINIFKNCQPIKDFALNNDEEDFLIKLAPPKLENINTKTYYKIGLLFDGVNLIKEDNAYIPVLGLSSIIYTKKTADKFNIDKITTINTFSVVNSKIKEAQTILQTFSKIIRENAKYKFKQNPNVNPYAFKLAGSNLMYSTDEGEIGGFKYMNLNGNSLYGLDTSLILNLPNTYSYDKLNNKNINKNNPPIDTGVVLDLNMYNTPKEDNINNLEDSEYIYKLEDNGNGKLSAFESSIWDTSPDVLYQLVFNGKSSDYNSASSLEEFKDWYFFNKYNNTTIMNNSLYEKEYEDIYNMWYKYTDFVGLDNYAAIKMDLNEDEDGKKIASLYTKTLREYFQEQFNFVPKNYTNPFFKNLIDFTVLVDNSSNLNYPYTFINSKDVTIVNNYAITFGLPYVVDYDDYKQEEYDEKSFKGIMYKTYKIGVIN